LAAAAEATPVTPAHPAGGGTPGRARAAPGRTGPRSLDRLAADSDSLVRAAALTAAGGLGCPPPLFERALAALADPAWQVREGAAHALHAADPAVAAAPLAAASTDPHADVRNAAVTALAQWPGRPEAAAALEAARTDPDADVRAVVRHALTTAATHSLASRPAPPDVRTRRPPPAPFAPVRR
jgi:HEAT repeat protein